MTNVNRISLIGLEWNCYNGFILDILHIEASIPFNMDNSLFGISASKGFFYIDIFFFTIKIKDINLKP